MSQSRARMTFVEDYISVRPLPAKTRKMRGQEQRKRRPEKTHLLGVRRTGELAGSKSLGVPFTGDASLERLLL